MESSRSALQSDADLVNAKAYLQQQNTRTGDSLYNHLTRMLTKLLDERPNDAVDMFEGISASVKSQPANASQDNMVDKPEKDPTAILAETQLALFSQGEQETEEEVSSALPNLMEQCYNFEQSGVGLNREEMVRIWLAMKALLDTQPIETIRFWGKILGIRRNYIVVEVDFREGEGDEEDIEDSEEQLEDAAAENDVDGNEEGEQAEVDVIPKPVFKQPPVVPKEENRTGVNKKSYFVCNEPGQPWTRLPQCTPSQIATSRKIKKFFTGNLEEPIVSYPPFPGNESNYLRVQIARISAATHISPVGYYMFDEDEEEDSSGYRNHVLFNTEYEPLPARELTDPSNWVHHVLHILPQGRTTWWNPVEPSSGDLDNDEEDEEREEQEEVEPEVGPPMLTPLSEDAELDSLLPWSAHLSSRLIAQYSLAIVHSCLWPGAHTFSNGRMFENIYVGWGHKYSTENYNPTLVPPVQSEFSNGPQITEAIDPTPEEEAALRAENAPEVELDEDEAQDDNNGAEENADGEEDDEFDED